MFSWAIGNCQLSIIRFLGCPFYPSDQPFRSLPKFEEEVMASLRYPTKKIIFNCPSISLISPSYDKLLAQILSTLNFPVFLYVPHFRKLPMFPFFPSLTHQEPKAADIFPHVGPGYSALAISNSGGVYPGIKSWENGHSLNINRPNIE